MFGPGPAPICGVSCSVLSCAVALMPPVGGAGEGTTVRTGPGTWISGRLTSLVCPRPGLGPRPLPLPHSRGARTSVSRCCRPQALLQQWLRPQKSVLPDRRFLQGLRSGKVRIRSLNLMPAFPFCPLGASRRKASPHPAQGLPWHRVSHGTGSPMAQGGHGPAAGSEGRRPGLSPPPGEKHLEARETRAPASFPTSGAAVNHGPVEAPAVQPAVDPPPAQVCPQAERRGALQQGVTETRGDACGASGWSPGRTTHHRAGGWVWREALSQAEAILCAQKLLAFLLTQQSVFLHGGQSHRLTQCLQDAGQSRWGTAHGGWQRSFPAWCSAL